MPLRDIKKHWGPVHPNRDGLMEWSLMSSGDWLRRFRQKCREIAPIQFPKATIVAALGSSGLPLATSLALDEEISSISTMIHIRDGDVGCSSPRDDPISPSQVSGRKLGEITPIGSILKGKHVLLVDSVLKTGSTARQACIKLKMHGARVDSLLVIGQYINLNGPTSLDDLKKWKVQVHSLVEMDLSKDDPLSHL